MEDMFLDLIEKFFSRSDLLVHYSGGRRCVFIMPFPASISQAERFFRALVFPGKYLAVVWIFLLN